MKKLLLLLIFLIGISCENTQSEFQGFGKLNIGSDFNSMPVSKSFTKVMEDEFNIRLFELSNKIGNVSDLNITTENGKISEVKFSSNEDTNISELKKASEDLVEVEIDQDAFIGIHDELIEIQTYKTKDEKIFFSVLRHKDKNLKNGQPLYEYSYIHKDAVIKKRNEILKNISKK